MKSTDEEMILKEIATMETDSILDYLRNSVYVDISRDLMRINDVLAVYPGYITATAEELMKNIELHSYDKIFRKIMCKFQQKYGYVDENLSEIHDRSFFELDALYISSKANSVVFLDAMFSDFLHAVFVLIFLWDNHLENSSIVEKCYKYLIANFFVFTNLKNKLDIYLFQEVINEIKRGSTIFNIAVGCQYFCVYFIFAHEISHGYFKQKHAKLSSKQEEYWADSIAYEITLDLLLDEKKSVNILNRELLDYCFYAPMLLFDIIEVYYLFQELTDKRTIIWGDTHPDPINRKRNLFRILNNYNLNLDETTYEEASIIFRNFSGLIKEFKRRLKEDSLNGELDKFTESLRR